MRRVTVISIDDPNRWIGEADSRHGPRAYDRRLEHRGRYRDLLAGPARAAGALAACDHRLPVAA